MDLKCAYLCTYCRWAEWCETEHNFPQTYFLIQFFYAWSRHLALRLGPWSAAFLSGWKMIDASPRTDYPHISRKSQRLSQLENLGMMHYDASFLIMFFPCGENASSIMLPGVWQLKLQDKSSKPISTLGVWEWGTLVHHFLNLWLLPFSRFEKRFIYSGRFQILGLKLSIEQRLALPFSVEVPYVNVFLHALEPQVEVSIACGTPVKCWLVLCSTMSLRGVDGMA